MEGTSEEYSSEIFNSLESLPDDCISNIISLTSPRDACIFATLSSHFRSVADSDQVWDKFILSNYHDIMLPEADDPNPSHFSSKKDLFFRLCDPILINHGKNSIALDKTTGKICYMVSAKQLDINQDWDYPTFQESRFTNVGQQMYRFYSIHPFETTLRPPLLQVDVEVRSSELSDKTTYVVYLIYKLHASLMYKTYESISFIDSIPETCIMNSSNRNFFRSCLISKECVHPSLKEKVNGWMLLWGNIQNVQGPMCYFPKEREDGEWMEVALGEFFNENGVASLQGESVCVNFRWLDCVNLDLFIIEGIEFRPKLI